MKQPTEKRSLSIVVMTYNEERNIGRCLDTVSGIGDEILILDSFSTDQTLTIAGTYGARIEQHAFENFFNQRRRLIDMATHDWILLLDADEWLSPELKSSILAALPNPDCDGYVIKRKNRIGTTWINHGSWYPDKKLRYFDRRKIVHVDNDPHDRIEAAPGARVCTLEGDLLHQADEDLSGRLKAIERYSTSAAATYFKKGKRWSVWRMMIKPCIRFVQSYVIKLGFLDGYYGWFIARSEAEYVWMREMKLWELWRKGEG